MPERSRKRPSDPNQLAKLVVSLATGEVTEKPAAKRKRRKNPAAVALGRRGGLKGGKARAAKLTPEERSQIARQAAQSRWKRNAQDG